MATLEQDYTTVPGQIFACISLVGPDCPQKNDKFGLKIRGCFGTRDEASSHAKRLQKEDATFDIGYGNVIEIDDIQIDVYEVMRHIIEVIDDFVNEDDVESEQNEELTIPGFENGSGLDQVTIY